MAQGTIIHYEGEPCAMEVDGQLTTITPVVAETEFDCGVGYRSESGGSLWGMMMPRDLITSWRATEILRHLRKIEHATLCYCFYAARRSEPSSFDKEKVEAIIGEIGRDAYDRIMAMPIPEQIIQAILDGQSREMKPSTYPITDEVRAGTITWRPVFTDYGIENPIDVDEKARQQEETLARYRAVLDSFGEFAGYGEKSLIMNHIDGALLTLLDKGADEPDFVLVAIAAVFGTMSSHEFAGMMMPMSFGPRTKEEARARSERDLLQACLTAADWLNRQMTASISGKHIWSKKIRRLDQPEYATLKARPIGTWPDYLKERLHHYIPVHQDDPESTEEDQDV